VGCWDCDTAVVTSMPGVLTKDQQSALIFETTSVQALLRHGVDQLLEMRYVSDDIDPGCWKWRTARSWPPTTVMQDQGHGVKSLNGLIDQQLGAAVGLPRSLGCRVCETGSTTTLTGR